MSTDSPLAALESFVVDNDDLLRLEERIGRFNIFDALDGARALGLNAELLSIYDELAAIGTLSKLTPFIAVIDVAGLHGGPMFQWHFMVPLQFAGAEVIFHDPADGPSRHVDKDDFLAAWATAGYRGVRVWTL